MTNTIITSKEERRLGVHRTQLVLPKKITTKQLKLARRIQSRLKVVTIEEVSNDS